MTKSFREIYEADKDMSLESKNPLKKEHIEPVITIDPVRPTPPPGRVFKESEIPSSIKKSRKQITTEIIIRQVLTEQREQSAAVLQSVMKTNTKIANGITKLIKGSAETNEKLVEAILALTDKIELLEAKLEAIENLEIPTPIVNLQMPNTKIIKEVHRDKRTGMITHITESEAIEDKDE